MNNCSLALQGQPGRRRVRRARALLRRAEQGAAGRCRALPGIPNQGKY